VAVTFGAMAEVTVVEQEPGTYRVAVSDGSVATTHTVRVPTGLPATLGCGGIPVVELVRRSFKFLLEREPPRSILRAFSLDEIGHYFPEYPDAIRRTLAGDSGRRPSGPT
jgi:hypothetical protein